MTRRLESMTKPELIVQFLVFVVEVTFFLMLHRQWRQLCHDRNRFSLFAIRDRLYVMLAEKKLQPSDPLFRGLRAYINSTLCWAEEIGAADFVEMLVRAKRSGEVPDFKVIMEAFDEATQKELKKVFSDLAEATFRILRFNSNLMILRNSFMAAPILHVREQPTLECWLKIVLTTELVEFNTPI